MIPKIGINGLNGVLNGLCTLGCFLRRINIARQTEAKANKVPNETTLLNTPMGNKPAIIIAVTPTIMVDMYGVRNL